MSQNVEEMVIKWSMDNSSFNRGVTAINRSMNVLKSEFKATDTNLKNFGKSSDQLKNKQEYLSKALKLQGEKVETLKKAYEKSKAETGENSVATERLAIQVNNATGYYSNLKKELKEVNKELENEKWTTFSKKLKKSSETLKSIGSKLTTKLTVPIVGLGTVSAKTAMTFEDSMAKLSSLMDKSVVSTDDMKNAVMELSNATGVSADEIAEAGYTAISSGADTANALSVVKSNVVLAKTGFTDLATAMDLSTTVMNAYGMSADKLGHISDVLNVTQDKGKTTIGALGESMGNVIPTATMYNVSLEQLSAGYAALTKNGIQTSQAGVALNSMLSELGQSGTKASDIIKEKTGKSFTDLMNSGASLTDVLKIVDKAAQESGLSIGDIFSNKNAIKGASSLTKNANDFEDALGAINNTAGITDDKLNQLQTTNTGIKKALNELKNAAIEFGELITPIVSKVAEGIKTVAEKINGLDDKQKKVVLTIGAIVAAVGPALSIFGRMAGNISKLIKLYTLFKDSLFATRLGVLGLTIAEKAKMVVDKASSIAQAALNAVMSMNPITLIIIGITALIAIVVVLYKKCEPFRNFINQMVEVVKVKFKLLVTFLKGVWSKAVEIVKSAINAIKVAIMVVVEVIKGIVTIITLPWRFLWENCKEYVFKAFNAIKARILYWVAWCKIVWTAMKGVVFKVWDEIKNYIIEKWNTIKAKIKVIVDSINNNIILPVKNFFTSLWQDIKDIVDRALNKMHEKAENAANKLEQKCQAVKDFFNMICEAISNKWHDFTNTLSNKWNSMVDTIKSAWESIKAPFKAMIDYLKSAWEGIKEKFKLPHFSVTGSFSLNPPSIPHLGVEWYANGGILTRPTVFGMNGSNAMVGGEAGAEAVIPLNAMYSNLRNIIREESNNQPIYVVVNVDNNMDSKALTKTLTTQVKQEINRSTNNYRRTKGGIASV